MICTGKILYSDCVQLLVVRTSSGQCVQPNAVLVESHNLIVHSNYYAILLRTPLQVLYGKYSTRGWVEKLIQLEA